MYNNSITTFHVIFGIQVHNEWLRYKTGHPNHFAKNAEKVATNAKA